MERVIVIAALLATPVLAYGQSFSLSSPDGKTQATVTASGGVLSYTLARDGQSLIESSRLGLTLTGGVDLGANVTSASVSPITSVSSTYATRGVHSTAIDQHKAFTLTANRTGADTQFNVQFRVFNDGLAYRYVVPGSGSRTVTGEQSSWTLPTNSTVWRQGNTVHYEGDFGSGTIGSLNGDAGGPVVAKLTNNRGYVAITEAALYNYSGLTQNFTNGSRTINSEFLDNGSGWSVAAGSTTPWRVAIATPNLNGLVNSDMVSNLSPAANPTLFADTSYIRPGRSTWSWLDGGGSLVTPTKQKEYALKAHNLGLEYNLIDDGWESNGTFGANAAARFAALKDVVDYGHQNGRNVDTWVWKRYNEVDTASERDAFFASIKAAGVVGVKIDFMDSESQSTINFYEDTLKDAAEYKLMINFHGANKPAGESRTYPNEMTREGIKGRENGELSPAHNATLPFTRLIAGHADYTPVKFNDVSNSSYAAQLSMAGLFTSPVTIYADANGLLDPNKPQALRDMVRSMPTVWDETIVLDASEIGTLAAFARRHGKDWFLFILNGTGSARTLDDLSLGFLGAGGYDALLLGDGSDRFKFSVQELDGLTSATALDVNLLSGGGFVARFVAIPEPGSLAVIAAFGLAGLSRRPRRPN